MKRITAIALLALASLFTAGAAMAADDRGAQATVPFAFNVGDKALPAGVYIIHSMGSGVLELQSKDRKNTVMSIAFNDSNEPKNGNGVWVFNRYGDKYFLTEVLCPAGGMSVKLPTSKLERKAQINEAALPTTTQILVATK